MARLPVAEITVLDVGAPGPTGYMGWAAVCRLYGEWAWVGRCYD